MPQMSLYDQDGARLRAESLYRTACDGGDPVDCSAALTSTAAQATTAAPAASAPTALRETLGYQTLNVATYFSVTAATVVLTCVLFRQVGGTTTPIGVQQATATATNHRVSASGDYIGGLLAFDLGGATHYEVRCANPSDSANVDLRAWET